MSQELLFHKYEIFGVVQGQTEGVKKRVQSIPANTLLNASEHDLVQALVEELLLKQEWQMCGGDRRAGCSASLLLAGVV